mmetsp:Transcript_11381/g.28271  ORF Transcript_11381/g.28271 Transcript_11381/m.28271 type:complete len:247 (+) Transcript_11381:3640-4380(+)
MVPGTPKSLPMGSSRCWGWLKRPSTSSMGMTPIEAFLGLVSVKTILIPVLAVATSVMRAVRKIRVMGFHWAVWLRLALVPPPPPTRSFWIMGMSHASGKESMAAGPASLLGIWTAIATLQRVKSGTLSLTETVIVFCWQGNLELCDMSRRVSSGLMTYMGLLSLPPVASIEVDTMGMPLAAMLTARAGSCAFEGLKTVKEMTWRASSTLVRLLCVVPPLGRQQSRSSPTPMPKAGMPMTSSDSAGP